MGLKQKEEIPTPKSSLTPTALASSCQRSLRPPAHAERKQERAGLLTSRFLDRLPLSKGASAGADEAKTSAVCSTVADS